MGATDWRTPPEFFAELHREFSFTLDAAASHENALLPRYCTPEGFFGDCQPRPGLDGLAMEWEGERVWINPPYSPGSVLYRFVEKASKHARGGGLAVMLLNATTTDTRWFHAFIWNRWRHRPRENVELRFLKGRIAFHGVLGTPIPSPRYPNMVVVFHPEAAP